MDKKIIVAGVLIVLVVAGGYYLLTQQKADNLNEVTVMMPFVASSEWAGFYAADLKGYYADEGLKVTIEYTDQGAFAAATQLAGGHADFAYTGGDTVLIARSQGMPLVAVYQNGKENLFGIVYKKGHLKTPGDLRGGTIAIPGPNAPVDIATRAILSNAGVPLDEVEFVPVGSALIPALLQDQTDAIAGLVIHELILQGEGIEADMWHGKDFGANFAGGSIVTTEQMIAENPKLVERFVRATHKGFVYAMEHPEEVVDASIAKFYPEGKASRDLDLAYWKRQVNEDYVPTKYKPGLILPEQWALTMEGLLKLGVIHDRVDVTKAYTTAFLPY